MRKLVDEALRREGIGQMRHAALRAARQRRGYGVPVAAVIRHQACGQLVGGHFGSPQTIVGHAAPGERRGAGHALRPRDDVALAIEHRGDPVRRTGAIEVVREIIAARPQQPHRLAGGLRKQHGFGDVIVVEPTAETATHPRYLDFDLRGPEPGQPAHHGVGLLRRLRRHHQRGALLFQPDQAIHRLGHGMRKPRLHVARLETPRTFSARGDDVAVVAHADAGRLRIIQQRSRALLQFAAVLAAAGTGFPVELELVAALQRGPGVFGQHGHRRREHGLARWQVRFGLELHHFHHALHRERRAGVDGGEAAVRPRTTAEHRDQCLGEVVVAGETQLAGDDGTCVDVARGLADEGVAIGRFQRQRRGGRRDLRRVGGKRAVACATTVEGDYLADFTAQSLGSHAEAARRGLDQQPARQCAGLAQIGPSRGHRFAHAAALVTIAPHRLAVALFHAQAERPHADALPVGIELVGDDARDRSGVAGAGFRLAHADQHVAVGIDAHEGAQALIAVAEQAGRQRRFIGESIGDGYAHDQRAGTAGQHLEESASRCVGAHGLPPPAARLIARRTRVWQPQRHSTGKPSMSSSEGSGLRCSRSTPATNQPGVQ